MALGAWAKYRQMMFFRSMASSCRSGLNPAKALDLLARSRKQRMLLVMADHVRGGSGFAEAMKAVGVFDPWQSEVVAVGETSGRLDESLTLIAKTLEEQRSFWMTVLPMMCYPLLMLHVAAFVFAYVGGSLGGGDSSFSAGLVKMLGPFYAAGIGTWLLFQLSEGSRLLSRLPLISTFRKANFATYLNTLIRAAVPYSKALPLALAASRLRPQSGWDAPQRQNLPVWEQLEQMGIFSETEILQIASAEEAGSVDEALERLSADLWVKGQALAKAMSQILPTLIYLVIMCVIAYKILQFYSGYFKTIDSLR